MLLGSLRNMLQEAHELGMFRTTARVAWEIKLRSGMLGLSGAPKPDGDLTISPADLPFADPGAVRASMVARVTPDRIFALRAAATAAMRGRMRCFSRWEADFGDPVDWHLQPLSCSHWPVLHWSRVLRHAAAIGDVKLTWEVGRFPHAYYMARAAAFQPELAPELAASLFRQFEDFRIQNPFGTGVHWQSSQEIAVRLWAWLFAASVFRGLDCTGSGMGRDLFAGAVHVARYIDYAQHAVYNNHLLSEALCLYVAGALLPNAAEARRWRALGSGILTEQACCQIYPDGGYIQNSHNYHRFAMQVYLLALTFQKQRGAVPTEWRAAMERSLDFLCAHQNPEDGRLPNYGANDGALPLVLTTCDYSDFRPTLQALSIATRNERIYAPGPWDEEACWLLGPQALDAPLRAVTRKSVSFSHTGYHVLRGREASSFATFRCGDLLDRFSQIDMLHLDVWWRGNNVLVDPGSYLYNGPPQWHNHFFRTASHNTAQVDGHDQMLHFRRFKNLYWTRAKLLHFEDAGGWVLAEGEHYGYTRYSGRCVHRRSILFTKDDIWIVLDRISGQGAHRLRLHWLGGEFPFETDSGSRLVLHTPDGLFTVSTFDDQARPLCGDVVAGSDSPPRGWISRYYAHKTAVPSFAVEIDSTLPARIVSVLSAGVPTIAVDKLRWMVAAANSAVEFTPTESGIDPSSVRVVEGTGLCQR